MTDFRSDLQKLINRYSKENGSDTPDRILADYLIASLAAFDAATVARDRWYGHKGLSQMVTIVDENDLERAERMREPKADKRPTAKHASIYEQHINDLAQAVLQVYPLGLPENFNWDDAIEALRENAVDDEDAADDLSQHADHRVDVVRRVLELMEAQS